MKLTINDPRQYSSVYPDSNILINQAQYDLSHQSDGLLMQALVSDALKDGNDQLLSVAYNLAPTQEIANYLWDNLQQVLNPADRQLELLAYPVVLIVGSNEQVQLASEINQTQLQKLFEDNRIFAAGAGYVSGKLYDSLGLSRIKPSQLVDWNQSLSLPQWQELVAAFSHSTVVNIGEGVHLRFLLLARTVTDRANAVDASDISAVGMELLKLLNNDLKNEAATLFPLPFPACELSQALARGEFHRQEIDITLNLSNLVKKLRQNGLNPFMKISSQKNNLQLEVWCQGESEAREILLWRLQRSDNFEQICEILGNLFVDMQLSVEYYPEHDHDD